jgi:putative membrane protein
VERVISTNPLFKGAFAGFVGTLFMTGFMLLMHRVLPRWQRYALPPERITKEFAERTDVDKHMDKKQLLGTTLVFHFGFGMSMGAIYDLLAQKVPLPAALKGLVFGLIVWTASYMGWLPVLGFREAAPKEPQGRNILMIAAHVVWGTVTGVVADMLELK